MKACPLCVPTQGRACALCLNASRAALALAPLHTGDGGHSVNGGLSFPIEPDQPDEPIASPEECEGWTRWALGGLAAVTLFCIGMAVIAVRSCST